MNFKAHNGNVAMSRMAANGKSSSRESGSGSSAAVSPLSPSSGTSGRDPQIIMTSVGGGGSSSDERSPELISIRNSCPGTTSAMKMAMERDQLSPPHHNLSVSAETVINVHLMNGGAGTERRRVTGEIGGGVNAVGDEEDNGEEEQGVVNEEAHHYLDELCDNNNSSYCRPRFKSFHMKGSNSMCPIIENVRHEVKVSASKSLTVLPMYARQSSGNGAVVVVDREREIGEVVAEQVTGNNYCGALAEVVNETNAIC